jgi:hypothetical protein
MLNADEKQKSSTWLTIEIPHLFHAPLGAGLEKLEKPDKGQARAQVASLSCL